MTWTLIHGRVDKCGFYLIEGSLKEIIDGFVY